jgi:Heavy metal associated domain 2
MKEDRMGYYLHEVPGRVRIKVPALKRNPHAAHTLQGLLKRASGVESVAVNTVTGSVLVQFDPMVITSRTIVALVAREGYLEFAAPVSKRNHEDSVGSQFAMAASKAVLGLVLDRALQGTPFAVLTAFI